MNALPYRVYWQPGCTSCLKMKDFLTQHGVAFESINVRERPEAMAELARMGAKSVPVVARGDDFAFGQELQDVARFIGVELNRTRVPIPGLFERIDRLLTATEIYTRALPALQCETRIPGRAERGYIDLAFHIPMIVRGFLDAATGGELTYAYFERRPSSDRRTSLAVVDEIIATRTDFKTWRVASQTALPDHLKTYYGRQTLHGVLERTAWHAAQHCRQLHHIVSGLGITVPPLGPAELDGLPLPDGVSDKEIQA